jgi:hypothetical protein
MKPIQFLSQAVAPFFLKPRTFFFIFWFGLKFSDLQAQFITGIPVNQQQLSQASLTQKQTLQNASYSNDVKVISINDIRVQKRFVPHIS